jgi:hypothetical protein
MGLVQKDQEYKSTELLLVRPNWCKYMRMDRLCDLAVKVGGNRSRGPGFDSRSYQIFWEVVVLEQGPMSLERIIEKLRVRKISGSSVENRD